MAKVTNVDYKGVALDLRQYTPLTSHNNNKPPSKGAFFNWSDYMPVLISGRIYNSEDIIDMEVIRSGGNYGLLITTTTGHILKSYSTYNEANLYRISIMEGLDGEYK